MRTSEFWTLIDDEFGLARGRALVREQVLATLGFRTAEAALEAGDDLRTVWAALCDEMDVPEERRWGVEDQAGPRARGR